MKFPKRAFWNIDPFDSFQCPLSSLTRRTHMSRNDHSWMKKHDEVDYAPDMIELAEYEPDPEEIKPYHFESLLMELDDIKASLRGRNGVNGRLKVR